MKIATLEDTVPAVLTVEQVAAVLRTSKRTITRWMDEKKIPSFRRGRTRRCPTRALEEMLGIDIKLSHLAPAIKEQP
jgi:excisionase family DNA binding protein